MYGVFLFYFIKIIKIKRKLQYRLAGVSDVIVAGVSDVIVAGVSDVIVAGDSDVIVAGKIIDIIIEVFVSEVYTTHLYTYTILLPPDLCYNFFLNYAI